MDETKLKKRAAIPPQYAGEVSAGAELPVRVHEDSTAIFAVDWDAL